jgi:hypothetical protein
MGHMVLPFVTPGVTYLSHCGSSGSFMVKKGTGI